MLKNRAPGFATLRIVTLSLGLVALAAAPTAAGKDSWQPDISQAMQQAESSGKDILMDFTGSDWCSWCVKLTNEVFADSEFESEAGRSFVLAELDFPSDKSDQPERIAAQNEVWSEMLEIESYPTVILADSEGRPYAKTGYREGGPEAYLEHLEELQQRRIQRDAAFARAAMQTGSEKAKSLDKGLRAVGAELVFTSYKDVVESIIELDADNEAGVRQKYQDAIARRQVGQEVQELMASFTLENAADYVDRIEALQRKHQPEGRLKSELRGVLAQVLIAANRPAEAIEIADEILSADTIHPTEKLQWRILKVTALQAQQRIDAAIDLIDEIASDHQDQADIVAACVSQKAQLLMQLDRFDDALAAVNGAIDELQPGDIKTHMEQMLGAIESRMSQGG